jgi:transcriptional regulator with XRE-family HTH domain
MVCTTLPQKEFAATLGASKQQYNNWVHGTPVLPAYAADLVLQYGVTLDWLYLGDPSGLPFALKSRLDEEMALLLKSKPSRRTAG